MSKTQLNQYQSFNNDENVPNNSQNSTTTATLSKRLKPEHWPEHKVLCEPEERVISHRHESSNSAERTGTERVIEEYEEAAEEEDKAVKEDVTAVEEEVLKDKVGSFSKAVYSGDGFKTLNFKDEECGEPLRDQHLRIDFSPIEGVDDSEFIMKKCQDFWRMIEENPRIHGLRASPETYYDRGLVKSASFKHSDNVKPTATNWLKRNPELMSEAFTTKNKKLYCDDNDDSCSDWAMKNGRKIYFKSEHLVPGTSLTHRRISRKSQVTASSTATETDAMDLCRQMEAWDLSHPKSMEPPCHSPQLTHAVMIRDKSII